MANLFPQSQRTASIALSVVGCIDYLAYGEIFTRAVFRSLQRKQKNEFFDSRKKSPRCSPGGGELDKTKY
jgi:hypothetical protein